MNGETAASTNPKIFISYSRDDLDFAIQLHAALELLGFESSIDREDLHAAEDWRRELQALIRAADTVIFVLSPSSVESKVCHWEVDQAITFGKRFIPVALRAFPGFQPHPVLQSLDFVFFYPEPRSPGGGFGSGLKRLSEAIRSDLPWLREHTRLLARAVEWDEGNRQPAHLLVGSAIAAARSWAARRPERAPEPTALQLDYIRASEAAEEDRVGKERARLEAIAVAQSQRAIALEQAEIANTERAKALQRAQEIDRQRARLRAGAFLAVSFVACIAGWQAWRAETARRAAAEQRDQALASQSRYLAALSQDESAEGRHVNGLLLSLEALPGPTASDQQRPFVQEAFDSFMQVQERVREIRLLQGHFGPVTDASFSPDGNMIATASLDRTVRIWNSADGRLVHTLVHEFAVRTAMFEPDGRHLVTAMFDSDHQRWDIVSGHLAESQENLPGDDEQARSQREQRQQRLRTSPDGASRLEPRHDGTLRIIDAASGKITDTLKGHANAVLSAAFSPDGSRVVTGSWDGTARVWRAYAPEGETVELTSAKSGVVATALSPDGTRLASVTHDGTVTLWSLTGGKRSETIQGDTGRPLLLRFSADGTSLVVASETGSVQIHYLDSKQTRAALSEMRGLSAADMSASGTRLAIAHMDGRIEVRNLADPRIEAAFASGPARVRQVSFSPQGDRLAVVSDSNDIFLFDPRDGSALGVLKGHAETVSSLAWSPDGKLLATASQDRTARVWRSVDGSEVTVLAGHTRGVETVAFSPDGTRIVTGSRDTTARIWDASGQPIGPVLRGHLGRVLAASFDATGRLVVTGAWDLTARVWSAETGTFLVEIATHRAAVNFAAFAPQLKRVITTSEDGVILLSRVSSARLAGHGKGHMALFPELVRNARADVTRCLGEAERKKFRLDSKLPEWCSRLNKWK